MNPIKLELKPELTGCRTRPDGNSEQTERSTAKTGRGMSDWGKKDKRKSHAGKAMICRLGGLGTPSPALRANHHRTYPECRVLVQGLRATRRSPSQQWRGSQGGKHQERDVEHHDHPEHSYTEYSTITPAGSDIEHPLNTLPFLQRPGGRVPMCLSDRARIRLDLLRSRNGRIRG